MKKTRRRFSLDEAARHAWEQKVTDKDYYALSSSEREILSDLYAATRWRQAASSAAMGRSKLYAFHLALRKSAARQLRKVAHASRDARMPKHSAKGSRAWEIWSEPDSVHEEWYYVRTFKDKGQAQAFVKRLQASQRAQGMRPYRYVLKTKKSPARAHFGSRARRRRMGF